MNTLGRYEIVSELGRGGMGVVYVGKDPDINRTVAIKCLHASGQNSSDEDKKRFTKETRALGRLTHPNIVQIYDTGEDPNTGSAYIVMEYVEGKSLAQILSSGEKLTIKQIREIGVQICMALDFAHEKGIVHRDIKPGNVLISPDHQTVKLVDFGIARLEEEGFTQTSSFLGTPRYMSPEQCTGDPVEKRSDLFSTSAVLYELLTLRKAFSGDQPVAIIHQVVTHTPDSPMSISKDVPKDLSDIIMKGLQKKPSDRFSSCKEMVQALSGIKTVEVPTPIIALGSEETVDFQGSQTPQMPIVRQEGYKKIVRLVLGVVFLLSALVIGLKMRSVPETPPTLISPTPPKAPVRANTGEVDFLIDPAGARVVVDGNVKGISPLLIALPAGSHEIKIIKAGYATLEATIDVPVGEKVTIELKLERQETK